MRLALRLAMVLCVVTVMASVAGFISPLYRTGGTAAYGKTKKGVMAMTLKITSPMFSHNEEIPSKYTCDGKDISPAIEWSGLPEGTKSIALIVDDPDAPDPAAPKMTWVHWVLYNVPPIGRHRYFHKLYALDLVLPDLGKPTKKDLEKAMEGHILAKAELVGTYQRSR